MIGRRIVVGAAVAAIVALGVTGAAGARWDPDWNDQGMMGPGIMGPGMMGGHGMMGGMMDPGVMHPEIMGPGMMDPGMGPYPHEWWDD